MSAILRFRVLWGSGALLIALGVLHLVMTPTIAKFVRSCTTHKVAPLLVPPMLLNHIVAGVLLIPLGYITAIAARQAANGDHQGILIARATAVTVATLPPTLFILMGADYFGATPFLVATCMVCLASITLLAAAFWPFKSTPNSELQPL